LQFMFNSLKMLSHIIFIHNTSTFTYYRRVSFKSIGHLIRSVYAMHI
jgi:hypothetical protein